MIRYQRHEARDWARENMHGLANVVIPSYTRDLKALTNRAYGMTSAR